MRPEQQRVRGKADNIPANRAGHYARIGFPLQTKDMPPAMGGMSRRNGYSRERGAVVCCSFGASTP